MDAKTQELIMKKEKIILLNNNKTGKCTKTFKGQITARKLSLDSCIKELYKGEKSKTAPSFLLSWIHDHVATIQKIRIIKKEYSL